MAGGLYQCLYASSIRGAALAGRLHVDAAGAKLEGLAFESDTSKPISVNPALEDIQPVAKAGDAQTPLWPWLALVAILLLVAERLVALRLKGGRTAMTACELIFPLFSRSGWAATCQETGWPASLASWGVVALVVGDLFDRGLSSSKARRDGSLCALVACRSFAFGLDGGASAGRGCWAPSLCACSFGEAAAFILLVDQSESTSRQPALRHDRISALAKKLAILAAGRTIQARVCLLSILPPPSA